jgi:hypothetical protein
MVDWRRMLGIRCHAHAQTQLGFGTGHSGGDDRASTHAQDVPQSREG